MNKEVGGKAENLIKLKELGYNVPDFLVVKSTEFQDLTEDKIKSLTDNTKITRYAVRSSANVEDSSKASYAGQFKTILDVNKKNLIRAINEVGSYMPTESFYSDNQEINISVIIQEYIEPIYSGVCFTYFNINLVINLLKGKGEELVSGKSKGEEILISRRTFTFKNKPKVEINFSGMIRTFLKIERDFNSPQDIEFCIDKYGKLWILQTRPVTA